MKKIVFIALSVLLIQCSSKDQKPEQAPLKDTTIRADTGKIAETSEITCPNCNFKKTESLPTDVCLLSYTCTQCNTVMHPKQGDCCVFCTFGDKKCPSKQ
jgi:hypothetical protein